MKFLAPHATKEYRLEEWKTVQLDCDNTKNCMVDEEPCRLELLDTTVQWEYLAMRDTYMRLGNGFLLLYSVTDRASFDDALELFYRVLREKDKDSFPMVVVANGCPEFGGDSQSRQVTTAEGIAWAETIGCPYLEADGSTGHNVEKAFYDLVREIRKYRRGPYGYY